MVCVGIVGNGPHDLLPDLASYEDEVDIWIGADRGALTIHQFGLSVHYAVGDFDSIDSKERETIEQMAQHMTVYPIEKDQTDIEIALKQAFDCQAHVIYLFGVTGGRLDHELVNVQLLHAIVENKVKGLIIDKDNKLELSTPNKHIVYHDEDYPNISFIPFTPVVSGLTLSGFYYPLENETITWGSTLCISNKLLSNSGTFSYHDGILLCIKSRDARSHPIPL